MTELGAELRRMFIYRYRLKYSQPYYGSGTMPQYDGGTDANGVKYKCLWDTIANKLTAHCIDFEVFVEFAFTTRNIKSPRDINRQDLIAEFKYKREQIEPVVYWDREEQVIITHVKLHLATGKPITKSINLTLNAKSLGVSPLICYCFARLNNCNEIAEVLKPSALKEFLHRKNYYLQNFGARIPPEFMDNNISCVD